MIGRSFFIVVLGALAMAGCGGDSPTVGSPLDRFHLAADPGTAQSVVEARDSAPSDRVVAVGRIGQIVPGVASFTLVDASLDYCGADPDSADDCPTPWDYCCIPGAQRSASSLLVEARGGDGRPLPAAELPGLRLLDLVVVQGRADEDEHGNVTIVADGWFRRGRPALRQGLDWPK